MPTYLTGDTTVMNAAIAGRPRVIVGVGDSIENAWFPTLQQVKDDAIGNSGWLISTARAGSRGPFPPVSPGAHVTGYWTYNGRQNTGSTTLNGATSIGASSIVVNSPFGGGTGAPYQGMAITIDSGGQAETLRIANSYDGASLTIPLATNTTKTHANGVAVSWKRQSGQTGYQLGAATEILFATAASPQDAAWSNGRFLDCSLLGDSASYGDNDESFYWRNGRVLNPVSVDVILLYLALPVNTGAPNLRMHGRTGEASPTEVTTDFSIFAASPTIKAVKLTVPTPASPSTTTTLRVTVNSPNAGSFTAGQVFVILDLLFLPHGAASGTVFLPETYGGMEFGDADNTNYGGQWTPAFQAQLAAALRTVGLDLDVMLVSLGVNGPPASVAAVTAELNTLRANLLGANPSAAMIGVPTYAAPNVGATVGARLSQGYRNFATNAGTCVFDWYSASGDATGIGNRYLTDGTHPNTTTGYQWAGDSVNGAFRTAASIDVAVPSGATPAGTIIAYGAYNTSTNQWVSNDQANHLLKIIRDGIELTPTNLPYPLSNGEYGLALTAGERAGTYFTVDGVSTTPNVIIVPARWRNGGTSGIGTGNTAVDHNTGGADNLQFEQGSVGIDGADVRAYLAADYAAGNRSAPYVKGQTETGPVGGVSGRMPVPMYLQSGNTYTIEFNGAGYETATATITI